MLSSSISPSTSSSSSSPLQQLDSDNNKNNTNDIFPIHILGSGSIGLLLASAIHDTYHKQEQRYNYLNNTKCSSENDDASASEVLAAAVTPPVTLLMRSHHKSHLISSWHENINSQCWFANITIRKGATNSIADTADHDHSNTKHSIVQQCNTIPVELIEDSSSVSNDYDNNYSDENNISNGHTTIRRRPIPLHCLVLVTKANDAIPALESIWDTRIVRSSSSSSSMPSQPLSSTKLSSSSASTAATTKIIILSNGALAIRDAIYRRFGNGLVDPPSSHQNRTLDDGRVQLILATTTHGAYRTHHHSHHRSSSSSSSSFGHYDITHAGVGSTTCTDLPFIQLCHSIGWEGECVSLLDMHVMLWKKLAVNCVINPLTAIHNVTNGQLLSIDDTNHAEDIMTIMRQILEEVSLVAMMEMRTLYEETMSMSSSEDGGYDEQCNTLRTQWLLTTTETLSTSSLEKFVHQVMNSTKDNISSMLQDVRSGKTTEVRFLNGYVASLGQEKYGIDCPRNLEMCRLVTRLPPIAAKD